MKSIQYVLAALLFLVLGTGCKKYLDEKPSASLVVPSSLADLQALLDYYPVINTSDEGYSDASADDYYLTYADWSALSESLRRTYTWEKDYLFDPSSNDWNRLYTRVYYANSVLENIEKIKREAVNAASWDNIKGQALFTRARSFLQAAFIWAPSFDSTAALGDLGIPLRLTTDFNQPSVRSSVLQTYDQIIADLKEAVPLLPVTPVHKARASKPAAYAMLARTFLSMRQYNKAVLYADSCLQLYNTLMDFNTLNPSASFPFPQFNSEMIFYSGMRSPSLLSMSRAKIDSGLYQSYATNDLRKQLYFKNNNNGTYAFKGSYDGTSLLFSGIAVDEVYFIRAECLARAGNTTAALNDLNTVLEKRWKKGTFIPFTASTPGEALTLILTERRKELLFRGLRWSDIKRLNKEGASITLKRILSGQSFTLQPNDPRYALPIPEDIIELTGISQNPR